MESNTGEFITFGTTHLFTLALVFFVAFGLSLIARLDTSKKATTWIRYSLAFLLIANELIYVIGLMLKGVWTFKMGLPLQICDLAIFAVAYSLIRHNTVVWEIAYFWGLGGTMQALFTPDLRVTFPDYIYIKFFLTHGLIVIGIIFLAVGLGRPIFFRSVKRVFVITNLYAAFIAVFNWLLGTNYLYLCQKPTQPSILDFFGPWPNYLVGIEITLVFSLVLYYLPFYFLKKRRGIKRLE